MLDFFLRYLRSKVNRIHRELFLNQMNIHLGS